MIKIGYGNCKMQHGLLLLLCVRAMACAWACFGTKIKFLLVRNVTRRKRRKAFDLIESIAFTWMREMETKVNTTLAPSLDGIKCFTGFVFVKAKKKGKFNQTSKGKFLAFFLKFALRFYSPEGCIEYLDSLFRFFKNNICWL